MSARIGYSDYVRKAQKLKGVRWQEMTKQVVWRLRIMRNDAVSAPLAASRRARHIRDAPNPQRFPLISTLECDRTLRTRRAERSGFDQRILIIFL